ncbi:7-deoxyloganetic acid glucosyltransferase-like [Impatiens glandulifera]|uniref:7-deoxyloganetic acid glucosyltransferase-like n=1 Tax=Impatiens glandulifera TaxID=253017 RepID=UPI001FB08BFA|nr:7-deoxyloganetic acid glucosyltransferase-like [Impatiens glandulifera]
MEEERENPNPLPHVLIFPLPVQGPVNCMLKLAELLCLAGGITITFLNTDHNHRRLLACTDIENRFSKYPTFQFATVPDGLPEENPRSGDRFMEIFDGLEKMATPLLKKMLAPGGMSKDVNCLIADGILNFAYDVADEVGVPVIYFDTISPCGLWAYLCLQKLIDSAEVPFKGNDLDVLINNVPGMKGFLRRRDLPNFYRINDLKDDPFIEKVVLENRRVPEARGLILNTFEELDGPIALAQIRSLVPNVYSIGPIHSYLKSQLAKTQSITSKDSTNSLWKEDRSCMNWLDLQPDKSVIYVSIGSLAVMEKHQVIEFWYGLVNSGWRFLWVRRPNAVVSGGDLLNEEIPDEIKKATEERGCLVSWAPQEEVISHRAIAGFFTHSGWNSTLESIVSGVPMLCWPQFVDQPVNSRMVSEVWKIGLDMKDTCDRVVIERLINELVEEIKREKFAGSASELARMAEQSIMEDGSSHCNFKRLVHDIKSMVNI